jgi:hypothetical protein
MPGYLYDTPDITFRRSGPSLHGDKQDSGCHAQVVIGMTTATRACASMTSVPPLAPGT